MLTFFDILTTVLSLTVPIALVAALVMRDKAKSSGRPNDFYTKASFILGWLLIVVMCAAAVVSLLKGEYFFMVVQLVLFVFFVRFMNRETVAREQTR